MYIRILPLLIFGFLTITFADSATQTDWSGGDGVQGPVTDWGNEFYQSSIINWSGYPGIALLTQSILEYTVTEDFDYAISVYSADINGDGYMDVLGAAYVANDITWWENTDGSGTSWIEHTVDGDFGDASSVYATDINGDGYMDVLGAAYSDDDITWWENIDGSGTSWIEHAVDDEYDSAIDVYAADINGDGYMDVLGADHLADHITWWENIDGSGTSWTEHTVSSTFYTAKSVYAADVNGDGYMDVLGAATVKDDITWWENVDGSGITWIEHNVDEDFYFAMSVYSADVNGDGYMDVLGAASFDDDITWWENIDGSGTIWTEHTVDGDFDGARSICAADINGDGCIDVLGAASYADDITWWENMNGLGTNWTEHTVDGDFDQPYSVYSADINGDGYMDVLGAATLDDDVTWWDVTEYLNCGWLESSILDTQMDPEWDYLEWTSVTPPGTSVLFQVRASDDHTSMGAWSDTLSTPCPLQGILIAGDQYIQYRTMLETSDPDTTPVLFDLTFSWNPVGIEGGEDPAVLALLPFSPNPASAPAVRFSLPEPASVELSIFDLSGRLISMINGEEYSPGYHDVLLGELSPGVYFCRMISDDFKATQRFVVIE